MSVASETDALAGRVAAEINTLRQEIAAVSGGGSGGGQTRRSIQVRNTDTTTNINPTSWTQVPITGTTDPGASGDFTVVGNGVRCNFAGEVRVTAHISMSASVARANAIIRLSVNGTPQGPKGKSGYIRNASGHNESSSSIPGFELTVPQDAIVTLESFDEAGNGTVTMDAGGCYLLLERWA